MSCLFCQIVAGKVPARLAYQDADVTAFHDIAPVAPVHLLVVPNRHLDHLGALDDPALGAALLAACAQVAEAAGLSGGYRVVSNVGADGGQSVGHLHFHVLGGRALGWPPG